MCQFLFQLLDHGDFWLNETPDKPALGWDAACIRICTWGKFSVKTAQNDANYKQSDSPKDNHKTFYYFNLHMDHVGVVARREAAKLVVKRIKEMTDGLPVILTGDFNVDQNDEIYTIFTQSGLLKDSFDAAVERGVNVTKLWEGSPISDFTVVPDPSLP